MSKYYYLIAGLPNIALDDGKLAYSTYAFKQELAGVLSDSDKKLVDLFYLKFDNKNLIEQITLPGRDLDPRGNLTYEAYEQVFTALKNDEEIANYKQFPPYFEAFYRAYMVSGGKDEKQPVSMEDQLASLYYSYAMQCKNRFIAQWFELNLNISNLLTAITCRKHGLEKADYIVGENEIAENLRRSNARDFGLGDSVDYLPAVQRIAEEPDLFMREKKIDQLKWEWLEEHTFFKTFDIERVFAYLLQLEMIERWVTLDKVMGENRFRELVGSMKQGSEGALEEFKRNNNK